MNPEIRSISAPLGTPTIKLPFAGSSAAGIFKMFLDIIPVALVNANKKAITHNDILVNKSVPLDEVKKEFLASGYSEKIVEEIIAGLSELPEYEESKNNKASRKTNK